MSFSGQTRHDSETTAIQPAGRSTVIINHTYRFVFIHIPKAAGTTVTRTLSQLTRYRDQEIGGTPMGEATQKYYMTRFGIRKHSRAETAMNVMGQEVYTNYFSFAFVRNPYTRLASAYYFLKSWVGLPQEYRSQLDQYPDFESFLRSDLWTSLSPGRGPDAIFQPQVNWIFSRANEPQPLVDFVGKTERLAVDFKIILERIGFNSDMQDESRSNSSPRYALPIKWDLEVVRRIQREYIRDFEAFDYSLEPPTASD